MSSTELSSMPYSSSTSYASSYDLSSETTSRSSSSSKLTTNQNSSEEVISSRSEIKWQILVPILSAIALERYSWFLATYLVGYILKYNTFETTVDSFSLTVMAALQYVSYSSCFISGFIADTWSGRFAMLMFGIVGAMAALVVITLSSYPHNPEHKGGTIISVAVIVFYAPMASIIRPLLMVMGADQFDMTKKQHRDQRSKFLWDSYWISNVAAALTYCTFLITANYLMTGNFDEPVSEQITMHRILLLVSILCLFLCMMMLLFASGNMTCKDPKPKAMKSFVKALVRVSYEANYRGSLLIAGTVFLSFSMCITIGTVGANNIVFTGLSLALILFGMFMVTFSTFDIKSILNSFNQAKTKQKESKKEYSFEMILAVCQIYKLFGLVVSLIPFWAIVIQLHSTSYDMACMMARPKWLSANFVIFPNAITIIIAIPVISHYKEKGGSFMKSRYIRLVIGNGFAVTAALFSAGLELIRASGELSMTECTGALVQARMCNQIEIGDMVEVLSECYPYADKIPVNTLNCSWLIIPCVLMGLGESLVGTTIYECFYTLPPPEMRASCECLQFSVLGIGASLGETVRYLDGHAQSMRDRSHAGSWLLLSVLQAFMLCAMRISRTSCGNYNILEILDVDCMMKEVESERVPIKK